MINKFRGVHRFSIRALILEQKSGLPVLGLIPCFTDIDIDSEDGVQLDTVIDPPDIPQKDKINIAVICVPHISNFTDFAPLQRDPAVRLHFLRKIRNIDDYDAVCLAGTKSTCADLQWLKERGWAEKICAFAEKGGVILGVCGGYQMLGNKIFDPNGVEGSLAEIDG